MLIAIDTSTHLTGLACYDAEGLRGECIWHSGRNHTAQVLPQLDLLLRHLGASAASISAVAVALGPGSWSGLRVGLSIAKGLALAGGLPLLGMGTLDAIAHQYRRAATPIYPIIRLGRERLATARFESTDTLQRLSDNRSVTLAELCGEVEPPALFCGDIDDDLKTALRRGINGQISFPAPPADIRRPGYLAALAWQRLAAGEHDDIARLHPIYLGEPVRTAPSAEP